MCSRIFLTISWMGVFFFVGDGRDTCIVSNSCGVSATSSTIPTVSSCPLITVQPIGTTVAEGRDAVFTVEASSECGPLHYQWQKNGVDVGEDTPTLTLANVQFEDHTSRIRCTVRNESGSTISEAAILQVTWAADLDGNFSVDFKDYAIFSACQQDPNGENCCGLFGIADIDQSGTCDFNDAEILALEWLNDVEVARAIEWVHIDDPGVCGYGGFSGYMSKYETTNAQYCEYLNAAISDCLITVYDGKVYAVCDTSHSKLYFRTSAASDDSQIAYRGGMFSVRSRDGYSMMNHPVVEVSWYGARAFCNYYGYRLPTELEWQEVADYDGSYAYGCGTTIDQSKANHVDSDYANPLNLSSLPYTSPVDRYYSYGYGMNDMAGNVWEWTDSCFFGTSSSRVLRGGSWGSYADFCTVSHRNNYLPNLTRFNMGFRVCR